MRSILKAFVFFLTLNVALSVFSQTRATSRITQAIDDRNTIALRGSVHPMLQKATDQGRMDGATRLEGVSLIFNRTAEQDAAAEKFLEDLQNPNSPSYHKWLTPEQYADRFGLSAADLAKVTSWLQSQGFTVNRTARGRTQVWFSGTVAQIETVFRTEMHHFSVKGESHFANSVEPSVPSALGEVVVGVHGFSNFRPKPRVKSLTELNAWLEDQCIAYAQRTKHPEFKDRTVWDVFQEERASLMALRGPFDGFVEKAVRASTTCLIMADHNRYSVDARAAGRMVLVRSHAERIVVLLGDEVVADHPRQFRRDQIIYDPWHYLPVLMKKPGALRNGAPFKDWALPPALTQVRTKLKQHADGDRQFVKVLGAVLDHGLAAVESACAEALEAGLASGDVILTVLARRRQPVAPPSITTPDALRLKIEPAADCGRYDSIRKVA